MGDLRLPSVCWVPWCVPVCPHPHSVSHCHLSAGPVLTCLSGRSARSVLQPRPARESYTAHTGGYGSVCHLCGGGHQPLSGWDRGTTACISTTELPMKSECPPSQANITIRRENDCPPDVGDYFKTQYSRGPRQARLSPGLG